MGPAEAHWRQLRSDDDAHFDRVVVLHGEDILPAGYLGHVARDGVAGGRGSARPGRHRECNPARCHAAGPGLHGPGRGHSRLRNQAGPGVYRVLHQFRIEDLRAAAAVVQGKRLPQRQAGAVVPGSGEVKTQAEAEGLDQVFMDAGMEWREPGCSMCLAMNADKLGPGEHCASTSNRNFEGRQGFGVAPTW